MAKQSFARSLLLLGILGAVSTALACLHFPKGSPAFVEGTQKVVLFHDGTSAHMIVATDIRGNPLPTEVAWVIPVPALPDSYSEVPPGIFTELQKIWPPAKGLDQALGIPANALKLYEEKKTRNYSIQPIGIETENAGNEFNAWLKTNNFNEMPLELQKAYLKKGAVFLAIRMKTAAKNYNDLNPIHIIYKSNEVTYPIKFTHKDRKFDLSLYVLSKQKLKAFDWEKSLGLSRSETQAGPSNYPAEKPKARWAPGDRVLPTLIATPTFFATEFSGHQLDGAVLATKPGDPHISLAELGGGLEVRKISFDPVNDSAHDSTAAAKTAAPANAGKTPDTKNPSAADAKNSAPGKVSAPAPGPTSGKTSGAGDAKVPSENKNTDPAEITYALPNSDDAPAEGESKTPPPAKPVAPAPHLPGWVNIDSVPRADEIKIDGIVLKAENGANQSTPLLHRQLPYGAHYIELKNSEHDSRYATTIHIRDGQVTPVEGVLK